MISLPNPGIIARTLSPEATSFTWLRQLDTPSTANQVASGNVTLAIPSAGGPGQLMVATIAFRGNAAFSMPSGWTQVAQILEASTADGQPTSCLLAYKVRVTAEATPVVFSRTGGNRAAPIMIGYTPSSGGVTLNTHTAYTMPVASSDEIHPGITNSSTENLLIFVASMSALETDTISLTGGGAADFPSGIAPTSATVSGPTVWNQVGFSGVDAAGVAVTNWVHDITNVATGATGNLLAYPINANRTSSICAAFSRV